jgi:hypothetical protein
VTIGCELGFAPGCLTSPRSTALPAAVRYVGLNSLGASPLVTNAFAMIRLDPRLGAANGRQSEVDGVYQSAEFSPGAVFFGKDLDRSVGPVAIKGLMPASR